MKKKYQIFLMFILSMLTIHAQKGTLGRITFSSGGVSSSKISVSVGESMSGTYKSKDGKIDFTVGSQIGSRVTVTKVDTLLVDKNTITSPSSGGKFDVKLTSNRDWKLVSNVNWAVVNVTQGNGNSNLSISVTANSSLIARTGKVEITAGAIVRTITINQAAFVKVDTLLVDKITINEVSTGGNNTVKITANRDWKVVPSASWISVNPSQGVGNSNLTISLANNTTFTARTGKVDVTAGAIVRTITINQAASVKVDTLLVDKITINAVSTGGNNTVKITANRDWKVVPSASWISVNPSQGVGNSNLTISLANNTSFTARTGKVDITAGAIVRTITINQAASVKVDTLLVDKTSINAVSTGGNNTVIITANRDWKVVPSASWISVNPSQGVGNSNLTISLANNTTFTARTGKVDVTAGAIVRTITINQAGESQPQDQFEISYSDLKLEHKASDTTLKITSNRSWELKNPSDWILFSANQGSGNAILKIYSEENKSKSTRTTVVVFTAGSNIKFLNIEQKEELAEVDQLDIKELINIYPNPVESQLTISLDAKLVGKTSITVLDASGKVVTTLKPENEKNQVDVSDYATGNYYLHFVNQENNINEKLMFNKLKR